jgi:hypothetical protein
MPNNLIKDLNFHIISIVFNIIGTIYLWVRNERSDRWISLFFMNVILIQLLQLIEHFYNDNVTSIYVFLLLFIHPLINLIGGFNYKAEFAFIEQIGIYLIFLAYIFISKVGLIKLDNTNTINKVDNTIVWNYLNTINYYEWAFYIFALLFSMYLYTNPQNITMMIGTHLLLFVSFFIANYKFNATFPIFYRYLSFLLGAVIMF